MKDIYSEECCGYCLEVIGTGRQLKSLFGQPEKCGGVKTFREWGVELSSGTQFYVYDYVDHPKLNEVYGWHIGGSRKQLEPSYDLSQGRADIINYFEKNGFGIYDRYKELIEWKRQYDLTGKI